MAPGDRQSMRDDQWRSIEDGWNVSMLRSTRRKKKIGCVPTEEDRCQRRMESSVRRSNRLRAKGLKEGIGCVPTKKKTIRVSDQEKNRMSVSQSVSMGSMRVAEQEEAR